jgi:nicotinate-nucleotide pyrophosphorylase
MRLLVIRTALPRSSSSSGTASRTNRAFNSALLSTDSVPATPNTRPNLRSYGTGVAMMGGGA